MFGYSPGRINANEYSLDRKQTAVSNKSSENYYSKEFDMDLVSELYSYFGILTWKVEPENTCDIKGKFKLKKHSESRC